MIGAQLAAWRETLGITQGQAAQRAGVPRKQYWKVENDKLYTIETFRRVVEALQPPFLTIGRTPPVTADRDLAGIRNDAMQAIEILQRLVAGIDAATDPDAADRRPSTPPISLDDPVVLTLIELLESRKRAG